METATKIQTIDRQVVKMIGEKVMALVTEEAKKLGLDVDQGSGSFNAEMYTMKLKFSIPLNAIKNTEPVDASYIKSGLAPRGTKIINSWVKGKRSNCS